MENYKIINMSELGDTYINEAVEIFVEGFYNVLTFSRDKEILKELFRNSLNFSMFYACIDDKKIIGILGLGNNKERPVSFKKDLCQRLFGNFKGSIVYKQLRAIMEKPAVKDENEGYIDYLTTDKNHRGKGAATALIKHICSSLHYKSYLLEVLSKNTNAKRLYENIGFKEFKKELNFFTILGGHGSIIKMRLKIK